MEDPEIDAMSAIAVALADLDEEARNRVLHWAFQRYGMATPSGDHRSGRTAEDHDRTVDTPGEKIGNHTQTYDHFAELFAAGSPKANEDKALTAAYWVQVHEGQSQWHSRRLNTELKNLGHGIPNITDALNKLMRKKPQLVIQLRKGGSSKQATKTYKMTNEGLLRVQGTLSSQAA